MCNAPGVVVESYMVTWLPWKANVSLNTWIAPPGGSSLIDCINALVGFRYLHEFTAVLRLAREYLCQYNIIVI